MNKIKIISLILFICVFSLIIPLGFKVIDPCSATPGYNYTIGYILLILYPLLSGLLAYILFFNKRNEKFKTYLRATATVSICIVLSTLTTLPFFTLEQSLADSFEGTKLFSYLFYYGCYDDIYMKDWMFSILYFLGVIFWLKIASLTKFLKI